MGKSSQRRGRRGEREAASEANEFDLQTRVHGIYESLDISIEGDPYEVKTCERLSMRVVTNALIAGARGVIHKFRREPRTMTVGYRDWLEDQRELKELRRQCPARVSLTPEGRRALAEAEAQDASDFDGAA